IFIYYEKTLYTPALTEGCVAGIMRTVVMKMAEHEGIPVVEAQISPEIMKEADEIFCTNSVQGGQWVMGYKQKRYFNKISRILQEKLQTWGEEARENKRSISDKGYYALFLLCCTKRYLMYNNRNKLGIITHKIFNP